MLLSNMRSLPVMKAVIKVNLEMTMQKAMMSRMTPMLSHTYIHNNFQQHALDFSNFTD